MTQHAFRQCAACGGAAGLLTLRDHRIWRSIRSGDTTRESAICGGRQRADRQATGRQAGPASAALLLPSSCSWCGCWCTCWPAASPDEVEDIIIITCCLLLVRHNGLRPGKAVVSCTNAVRVADGQACRRTHKSHDTMLVSVPLTPTS